MLVAKDCLDLKLVKTAHAADDFIWVSGGDAVKLNSIGVGNYINLTISDNRACETVRYDHVANWPATSAPKQLPVVRDVGATGRKNFGVNTCVVADWSVAQLTEYIEQVACAAPCLGSNTSAITSLSTSTSTGLGAVNSAVASLSTGVSSVLSTSQMSLTSLSTSTSTTAVSLSTGLSTVNSAVASLSTGVDSNADLVGVIVSASQLPSYVDDVLEFPNLASFPTPGEAGKIYTDTSTSLTYRWSGTTYIPLGGDYSITSRDQGTILTTATTDVNYVGPGVTATNLGGLVTVTVHAASTTQVGSVELATPTETIAGTSTTLAVTPAGLNATLEALFLDGLEIVQNVPSNITAISGTGSHVVLTTQVTTAGVVQVSAGVDFDKGGSYEYAYNFDVLLNNVEEIASSLPYYPAWVGGDYSTVTSQFIQVSVGDVISLVLTYNSAVGGQTAAVKTRTNLKLKYLLIS